MRFAPSFAGRLAFCCLLVAALTLSAAAHERVAFQTADSITLRGYLWGNGRHAVVLSHMFGTDQSIWFQFARKLEAEGFTVLTYDFRGVGKSDGELIIPRVDRDVVAAIKFVKGRRPRSIFLIGASMGGTASLVAAAQQKVNGVVVMASGMRFEGLDAQPHLPNLKVPKLFIVGSGDAPFNESAQVMYARTPQPKQLLVFPTDAHGTNLLATLHRSEIEQAILGFLRKYASD